MLPNARVKGGVPEPASFAGVCRCMDEPDDEGDRPVERNTTQARQGVASGRVVTVLAVSLGLVLLLFGLALMMFTGR